MEKQYSAKQLKAMDPEEFLEWAKKELTSVQPSKSGLKVKFPCDLRMTVTERKEKASPFHKWTAFLNNAGNLMHVYSVEREFHLRIKLPFAIKHLSLGNMEEVIVSQIDRFLVID